MFLGRFELGAEIAVRVQAVDPSGVPTNPDAAPRLTVYAGSARVESALAVPPADPLNAVGLFRRLIRLGDKYSAGRYSAVSYWTISGSPREQVDTFEVLPLGSADGAVIALAAFETPTAVHLVHQTDSGKLFRGKNPRIA